MVGLTLDSGALIAAEKGNRRVWGFLKEATQRGNPVVVPAGVVAQTWKGKSTVIARILRGAEVEVLDEAQGKRIGILLTRSNTTDVVDGAVVASATAQGHAILTSDPTDLRRIGDTLRSQRPQIIAI